jgi:hypothetical protein
METPGMKPIATLVAGLLLAGAAVAGDVYVTRDAQGNFIYTDTPQTIPAQKIDVHAANGAQAAGNQSPSSQAPTPAAPQGQTAADTSPPAADPQAAKANAADKAKRCSDARQNYQTAMTSFRLYEEGPNGERTYLTSAQIDAARANAKQVMDQFCSGQ